MSEKECCISIVEWNKDHNEAIIDMLVIIRLENVNQQSIDMMTLHIDWWIVFHLRLVIILWIHIDHYRIYMINVASKCHMHRILKILKQKCIKAS